MSILNRTGVLYFALMCVASLHLTRADETPYVGVSNFSARSYITPEQSAIIGFVVVGKAQNFLIRAVGPSLKKWGVTNPVSDPRLELFQGAQLIAKDDDWGTPFYADPVDEREHGIWVDLRIFGQIYFRRIFHDAGAAELDNISKDAALIVRLEPGVYTAVAHSNSGAGEVLLEGYVLRDPL